MKYSELKNSTSSESKPNDFYQPQTYYPYGELPLKYTKAGQEQLKKEYEQKANEKVCIVTFETLKEYIMLKSTKKFKSTSILQEIPCG